jgi:protein-ribulosamine 3-kinase
MQQDGLLRHLESKFGFHINGSQPVSGGDINQAFCLQTNTGKFFLKTNDGERFPGMLKAEASGLEFLRKSGGFTIPAVMGYGDWEPQQYLVLGWIQAGSPCVDFWENFGSTLALLHRQTQPCFGLSFDNYIGSLPQTNFETATFFDFYAQYRLQPTVKILRDKGALSVADIANFSRLFNRLEQLIPEEPPALLHGDLWAGNYMVGEKGEPVLIDPAPYYGHREMDIAMTQLFGGFVKKMLDVYNESFPLEKDWKMRIALFQLYPILVHAVLFGGHYTGSAVSTMKSYL